MANAVHRYSPSLQDDDDDDDAHDDASAMIGTMRYRTTPTIQDATHAPRHPDDTASTHPTRNARDAANDATRAIEVGPPLAALPIVATNDDVGVAGRGDGNAAVDNDVRLRIAFPPPPRLTLSIAACIDGGVLPPPPPPPRTPSHPRPRRRTTTDVADAWIPPAIPLRIRRYCLSSSSSSSSVAFLSLRRNDARARVVIVVVVVFAAGTRWMSDATDDDDDDDDDEGWRGGRWHEDDATSALAAYAAIVAPNNNVATSRRPPLIVIVLRRRLREAGRGIKRCKTDGHFSRQNVAGRDGYTSSVQITSHKS